MKPFFFLIICFLCFSFCPSTDKSTNNNSNGFYVSVVDFTNKSYHKFIFEDKDSVNFVFSKYFHGELDLGEIDYPISIFNGKRDFFVARVNVYQKSNGKLSFKHLKYPKVYDKNTRKNKRLEINPVYF